jgi:magnesium-transporting ATPase (P-type)
VQALKEAGIHFWMLTGDKVETAINIARAAGIAEEGEVVCYTESEQLRAVSIDVPFVEAL